MTIICGQHNQHLARIEQALSVSMDSFGNQIKITGLSDKVELASKTFTSLYKQLSAQDNKDEISTTLVDDVLRQTENGVNPATTPIDKSLFATTWKKKIFPRTAGQAGYFKLLHNNEVVFGLGPAGTGKTYMAVAWAVDFLKRRQVERIILSRPAVEAGERLGFLPGDMKEKVDPYLRPLYDALYDMMPSDKVDRMLASGEIEIAPLAFMRGRTLSNAFVIIDEAQNTTPVQMKMVLTRLGEDSRMAITGDLSQIDLPSGQLSGLSDAVNRLEDVKGIGITRLSGEDVVRHPVVARILKAYDAGQK
ncbi:MAG: PhoH family protein [Alphaproteobacteria bacterium]|jgi:phosphate starvation-inducible PhoH-like protein|nr:PhoH family protein [Alphaproteobacteria bacterium]MBL6776346.1 PhoH family protein [Alphaproteobacteria bacterium]